MIGDQSKKKFNFIMKTIENKKTYEGNLSQTTLFKQTSLRLVE